MMDDQKKYNKCCVYWIGPCIPWVMTSDKNIIKKLIYQPGGNNYMCICICTMYVCIYVIFM